MDEPQHGHERRQRRRFFRWRRKQMPDEFRNDFVDDGLTGVGGLFGAQPEHDDCLARAREHGVAVREVMSAAEAAWRSRRSGG